jgi:hypothetical protein
VSSNSSFVNNIAGVSGGGLYVESQAPLVVIVSGNSSFIRNEAGGAGGGVAITQTTENLPSNLDMNYIPSYTIPFSVPIFVPALCYDTNNASNGTSVFREYKYASPYTLFDSTRFDSNRAVGAGGSGGALYALDMRVNLSSSTITSNEAGLSGGAIFLDTGTAALLVTGTLNASSIISNNSAPNGGAIYSGSAGGIELQSNTLIDLGSSAGSAITVISGGELSLGRGGGDEELGTVVVQCGMGLNLLNNITVANQQSDDWKIGCMSLEKSSSDTRTVLFTNPTCAQLNKTFPANPLSSVECPGLPLAPVMTYTSGTISCSPCATGLYSLSRGALVAGELRTITCKGCPFGAVCDSAVVGSPFRIYSKPNFWGHAVTVTEASPAGSSPAPTGTQSHRPGEAVSTGVAAESHSRLAPLMPDTLEQRAVFMNCPGGHCCKSNTSCPWASRSACQGNRDPTVPLCGDCLPGYSQAVGSTRCIVNDDCGQGVAAYVGLQLLTWTGFCLFFLVQRALFIFA